jgi:hypothetical protein
LSVSMVFRNESNGEDAFARGSKRRGQIMGRYLQPGASHTSFCGTWWLPRGY